MDVFRAVANKLSVEYDQHNRDVVFLAVNCMDLSMFFQKDGQQQAYNGFIQEQADIAFFVFDSTVGDETKKEFILACQSYSIERRPKIQVFVKENDNRPSVFEQLVNLSAVSMRQYFSVYPNNNILKDLVESALRRYVDELYEQERKTIAIGKDNHVINKEEAWGRLVLAQTALEENKNDIEKRNEAITELKDLSHFGINNWRFYFRIYRLLHDCFNPIDANSNSILLNVINKAKSCSFASADILYKCRIIKYSGVINRRLGNMDDALRDLNESLTIAKCNVQIRGEIEDILFNLFIIYSVLNEQERIKLDDPVLQLREIVDDDRLKYLIEEKATDAISRCKAVLESRKNEFSR